MAFLDQLNAILESTQEEEKFTPCEVEPCTESFLEETCVESAKELYKLQGALLMADVKLDQDVLESVMTQEEAEQVMEAAVGDYFKKAQALFNKIKAKVTEFINTVVNYAKTQFSTGSKLVLKRSAEIKSKAKAGVKYSMHKWTVAQGDAEVDKAIGAAQKIIGSDLPALASSIGAANHGADSENRKTVAKALGYDSVGALVKGVTDKYRNADKVEVVVNAEECIAVVTGKKAGLEAIKKQGEAVKKACDAAIKAVKDCEGKAGKEGNFHKGAAKVIAGARAELSVCNKLLAVKKTMLVQHHAECVGAIKAVLTHRAVKESVGVEESAAEELENNESVEESAASNFSIDAFMSLVED